MLDNYKISSAEVSANQVQSAPDTLTGTPSDNKRVFDNLAVLIVNKLNAVIEKLATDTNTVATDLTALTNRNSHIGAYVVTDSTYATSFSSIGLTTDTQDGTGIENVSGGNFTIKDSNIKAVRITAGGRYVPVDGTTTYVGYNQVIKNGNPVLFESIGYCISGASAMWQISGIIPVALNDVINLQGKASVASKVRRMAGTRIDIEAIY